MNSREMCEQIERDEIESILREIRERKGTIEVQEAFSVWGFYGPSIQINKFFPVVMKHRAHLESLGYKYTLSTFPLRKLVKKNSVFPDVYSDVQYRKVVVSACCESPNE